MLGEDDHDVIANDPVNADDLFGDDDNIVPPVSPENGNAENEVNGEATNKGATTAPKKHRQINRLPNLNEVWLTDSRRENITKVNSYFEKIKFRKGKGEERANLKMLLQRYEYFGQQCYPKLCFKDFVDKVEHVSAKRSIKHVLQDIRQGTTSLGDEDADNSDQDNNQSNNDNAMNFENHTAPVSSPPPSQPLSPTRTTNEINLTPPASENIITEQMKEVIRKKREEAIEKRKQKLEESMNLSMNSSLHTSNKDQVEDTLNDSMSKPLEPDS